jgi:hypothetical protein
MVCFFRFGKVLSLMWPDPSKAVVGYKMYFHVGVVATLTFSGIIW